MMAVAAVVALRLRRGRRGGERQVGGDEGEEQRAAHGQSPGRPGTRPGETDANAYRVIETRPLRVVTKRISTTRSSPPALTGAMTNQPPAGRPEKLKRPSRQVVERT